MLQKKGGNGFPYMVFMDINGAVLTDRIWPADADAVREAMKGAKDQATKFMELRKAASENPDDAVAKANLQIALAMAHALEATPEELLKLSETEGIDTKLKAKVKTMVTGNKITKAFEDAGADKPDRPIFMKRVEEAMYGLLKGGASLPTNHDAFQNLYFAGIEGAVKAKDMATAKIALAQIEKFFDKIEKDRPQMAERIKSAREEYRHKVAELDPDHKHDGDGEGHEKGEGKEHKEGGK